ncbi:transposable element Tcb1 transposase, partial [Trichonephila clavipes]
PVSSRTLRRRLAEGHLGSRCPLRVLSLTPTHPAHEETGLQRNGTRASLATNPDSISAVMTIVFVCGDPVVNALNHAFALQRHTSPSTGVMVWGAIAYNTRSPLVLIRGTMTAQRYVHDILQPHVLPLMQRLPGAIFQQDNARSSTVTTLPWPPNPQICHQSSIYRIIKMVSWASHEFERTRGKVTANVKRKVSRHHTILVCLNARSYHITHSR